MVLSKRTSQGGFLQTFIIIATILALITVGLVYFVKNRGETARREQAIALADQIASNDKPVASASGSGAAVEDKSTVDSKATSSNDKESTPSTNETSRSLPVTGPAENVIVSILSLGVLSASAMYYFESRRKLKHSL